MSKELKELLVQLLDVLNNGDTVGARNLADMALDVLDPPREYKVTWTVGVAARSPYAAALKAQTMQRDYTSLATHFGVVDIMTGRQYEIDAGLDEEVASS